MGKNDDAYMKLYRDGFNKGYLLEESFPSLVDLALSLGAESPGIKGLQDGREFYQLERSHEKGAEKESMPYHDTDWIKGVNKGYTVGKYIPELANLIVDSQEKVVLIEVEGLIHGVKMALQDKVNDYLPSWLKDDNPTTNKSAEPDKPHDKDKDLDMDH